MEISFPVLVGRPLSPDYDLIKVGGADLSIGWREVYPIYSHTYEIYSLKKMNISTLPDLELHQRLSYEMCNLLYLLE